MLKTLTFYTEGIIYEVNTKKKKNKRKLSTRKAKKISTLQQ